MGVFDSMHSAVKLYGKFVKSILNKGQMLEKSYYLHIIIIRTDLSVFLRCTTTPV